MCLRTVQKRPAAGSGPRRTVELGLCCALASCSGASDAVYPDGPETSVPRVDSTARPNDSTPAQACVAVMQRTRDCEDVYVPQLLALRVRLNQPPGIARRFEVEGRRAMLGLAHYEFARDWSDEAIARSCTDLSLKALAEQERIMAPERHCLESTDCNGFTACDLARKEMRWTTSTP